MGIIPQEIIDMINNTFSIAKKTYTIEKKQLQALRRIILCQEQIIDTLRNMSHEELE